MTLFYGRAKIFGFQKCRGLYLEKYATDLDEIKFFIYRKLVYFLAVPFLESLENVWIKYNNISRNFHFWTIFWRGWEVVTRKKDFLLAVILVLMICDVSRPVSLIIWTYEPVSQWLRKRQIRDIPKSNVWMALFKSYWFLQPTKLMKINLTS